MKAGDLIMFKRSVFAQVAKYALIRYIRITSAGTGQIGIYCSELPYATIPWSDRDKYIEIVNECG